VAMLLDVPAGCDPGVGVPEREAGSLPSVGLGPFGGGGTTSSKSDSSSYNRVRFTRPRDNRKLE
jgi:hypothetical protein